MKHTFQERLVAGLKALGYQQLEGTRRFVIFSAGQIQILRDRPPRENKFFVGRNGALRCGPVQSRSYSVGDPSYMNEKYKAILAAGDTAIQEREREAKQQKQCCGTCKHFLAVKPVRVFQTEQDKTFDYWCNLHSFGANRCSLRCGGDDYERQP